MIQSSTPSRRPRTRWATVERPVQTIDAEVGQHPADPLEVGPAFVAEHRRVDQQRVQLHRHQLLGRHRAGGLAQLPAGRLRALGEDGDESAVGVDHREPDGLIGVQRFAARRCGWGALDRQTERLYAHAESGRNACVHRIFTGCDASKLRQRAERGAARRRPDARRRGHACGCARFPAREADPRSPVCLRSS